MAQNEKTSPIGKRANVEEIELVDGDWTSGTYVNGVWYPRKERKWICLTISDSEHSYDLDITSFFLWYLNMSQPSPALVRKLDAVKPKTIDMDGLITNRRTGALYYRNSETSKTWRGFEYELKKWTDKAYKSAEKASKRARSERAKLAKQTASSSPTQDDYGRPESATTIPSDEEWLRSTHGDSDSRMFESKKLQQRGVPMKMTSESIINSIAAIITEDPNLFTDGDHLKQTTIDNINRLR